MRGTRFGIVVCSLAIAAARAPAQDAEAAARRAMVDGQIARRGIADSATLRALRTVPRHLFVPPDLRALAYEDRPLPIGNDQTISQPYIVAYMTEQLHLTRRSRVLEVGTGSGYQAAVLAELAADVFTIEIVAPLADSARARLARLGYRRVRVRTGDGYLGWPEAAPFDAVIVTAAADSVPPPLVRQLRPGGRMVIPVGATGAVQWLMLIAKAADGRTTTRSLLPVRFVPLTGRH
jgi:protein-L-isoaspartate(D-aspartate) O-methyltransferase